MPGFYQHYEQVKVNTSSYDLVTIANPGGYTFSKIHPNIVTEAMVSSQDTSPVLSATGTQLIQVFKASHDNIHQMKFLAALDYLASTTLCTFDFADDTALRAVWTTNSSAKLQNHNDKSIKYEGSSSMRITTNRANSAGAYIQKDLGSATNFSTSTHANFIFNYRKNTTNLQVCFRVVDAAGNSASVTPGVSELNAWTTQQFHRDLFIDDQTAEIDWTQIRYLRFVVLSNTLTDQSAWVDNLHLAEAADLSNLKIQLYHCGSTLPTSASSVSDWTLMTSDQGNSEFFFSVKTLKTLVGEYITLTDSFGLNHAQPELTIDDYYAIVFTWQSDDLVLRGLYSTATAPYSDGVLFQSADSGVTLTELTKSCVRFTLYSCMNCKITGLTLTFDAAPLNTKVFIAYNTGVEHCNSILTGGMFFDLEFHTSDVKLEYDKDNQIGIYIDHDKNSEMSYINIEIKMEYTTDCV